jgi:hypothetical protein
MFWNFMPCSLVDNYQRFTGICRLREVPIVLFIALSYLSVPLITYNFSRLAHCFPGYEGTRLG